jgi:transposase
MLWRRGKAYSQDLRSRVLARADAGDRVGQIAKALQVSVSYVSKALSRRRDSGEITARPQCNHVLPKLVDLHEAIRIRIVSAPDATLVELRAWLLKEHEISASDALLCKTLRKLNLTLKKSRSAPANKIGKTSPKPGPSGARNSLNLTPASWCSSTRPGPRPT